MAKIKVRARAVDMLGRQQIAGIPTAIHELLKNAHDAYANSVDVDYYRADQLLVIRDDGYGMTLDDFEGRWLTLGTESKVGANRPGSDTWTGPRNAACRPIMGEKGIGRLAIAAIGPQVLVLTRAARPDGLQPLVAALVNWRLFEIPGIDLESVDVPAIEILGGLPSRDQVAHLTAAVWRNVEELGDLVPPEQVSAIRSDLEMLPLDISRLQALLPDPHLGGDGYGTHFYIMPAAQILSDDIDSGTDDVASPLEKMLLGFSNTMMPDRDEPVIRTRFRDHHEDGRVKELIGGQAFFTPEEFLAADHHIEGQFDCYGQFSGLVSVYQQQPAVHTIQWARSSGQPTECGPFKIKFAYVQGRASESRLPPADWGKISQKLNRIGGLYVYRDGIRILPYGNSDFDFLNIERRRTKSAQDWFFSYRRIFGAVQISIEDNPNLVEKAGREGFRANKAYRQFVAILESFFERLAIDFFRPTSTYGDDFNTIKQDLIREAKLLERREKQVRERRRQFSGLLETFFGNIERGRPTSSAEAITEELENRLDRVLRLEDPDLIAQQLLDLEQDGRERLSRLREQYVIAKPRTFGMTKPQMRDWAAYQRNYERLELEVFSPLQQLIETRITVVAAEAAVALDRRRRLAASLELKKKDAATTGARLKREVAARVKDLSDAVNVTLRETVVELSNEIENTFADFGRTDTAAVDDAAFRALQASWEGRIDRCASEARERLESLRDQLYSVAAAVSQDESLSETTAALEARAEGFREQLDATAELAQLGMALGIVQHEFSSAVSNVTELFESLAPWGRAHPQLRDVISKIRGGFEHLEGYLEIFEPMTRRRASVAPVDMTGEELRRYMVTVFEHRLDRHDITLSATRAFEDAGLHGRLSTFYPAFVNIVDNAIYWITFARSAERRINLDFDGSAFLISNSGPGIEHRDAERIFEFGETSKPGGRGMGLYISRQALGHEGWELSLVGSGRDVRPVFRIAPAGDQGGDGEGER